MVINKDNFESNDSLMYSPYPVDEDLKITIKQERYSTSLNGRGYIPVYEYLIGTTPIMWDRETGYIHFTGIWKALGNPKTKMAKIIHSNYELEQKIITGGFLRIQDTWIPYNYAYLLCTRTAWKLRHELTPIFGPRFLTDVLDPEHKDFGNLVIKEKPEEEKKDSSISTQKAKSHKKNKSKAKKPYTKSSPRRKTRASTKNSSTTNQKTSPIRTLTPPIDQILLKEDQDMEDGEIMPLSNETSSLSPSGSLTPKPSTFRVVETYPSNSQYPSVIPVLNTTSASQSIIDVISASVSLQMMSQGNGVRPFNPIEATNIPFKVNYGDQEFYICWS